MVIYCDETWGPTIPMRTSKVFHGHVCQWTDNHEGNHRCHCGEERVTGIPEPTPNPGSIGEQGWVVVNPREQEAIRRLLRYSKGPLTVDLWAMLPSWATTDPQRPQTP